MANEAAFELRDDFKPRYADEDEEVLVHAGFTGGSVAVEDGTFDVHEALEEGSGYIVSNDESLIRALDGYPALKRAALAEAKAAVGESDGLDKLNHDQLDVLAYDNDVQYSDDVSTKADKVAVLREAGVTAEKEE